MTDRDKYLLLEAAATFVLLSILIVLFWQAIPVYNLVLLPALAAGLYFSWFNRERNIAYLNIIINTLVLGDFVFIIHSALNSTFSYSDVILILLKGVLILQVILSFNALSDSVLNYMQALSILVFMGYPVLIKEYNPVAVMLILFYLSGWLILFRFKLFSLFMENLVSSTRYRRYQPYFLAGAVFLAGILVAGILFLAFPLQKIQYQGLLTDVNLEDSLDALEKEYYDTQDKVQGYLTKTMEEFPSPEDQRDILNGLNALLKESPDIMEVERAHQGLVSKLKLPGPGREKMEGSQVTYPKSQGTGGRGSESLEKLVGLKGRLNQKRSKENISDLLKKGQINLINRLPVYSSANAVSSSKTSSQLQQRQSDLKKELNNSSLSPESKKEADKQTDRLKEWKNFQLYRQYRESAAEKSEALEPAARDEMMGLLSRIEHADNVSDIEKLDQEAKAIQESASPKVSEAAADLREMLKARLEMLISEAQKQLEEKIKNESSPEYQALNSEQLQEAGSMQEKKEALEKAGVNVPPELQQLAQAERLEEKKKEEETPQPPPEQQQEIERKKEAEKKALFRIFGLVLAILCWLLLILVLILLIGFIGLYILREKKRRELLMLLRSDIRQFMIRLYEHSRELLSIFGVHQELCLPPLTYAGMVENRFSVGERLFMSFTERFEEAKYSSHILRQEDALLALERYNSFFQEILGKKNKSSVLFTYILTLIFSRPLFIGKP